MTEKEREIARLVAEKSNRYYGLLAEKHRQTDWNDRESIKAYNEYARQLRKEMFEL